MYRELVDGFVYKVAWVCTASSEDGEFTTSTDGTIGFQGSSGDPSFISYDDLTQEEVLAWVWQSPSGYINPDPDSGEAEPTLKAFTEDRLAEQLDTMAHPTTATGLPW